MRRILIDECVPAKLKTYLRMYECVTVPEAGLAGMRNGELLKFAEQNGFDSLLTLDRGFQYQQNLSSRKVSLVILKSTSNRLDDVAAHLPELIRVLAEAGAGQIVVVG